MQDREYIEKWLSGSLSADEKVSFEETATFRGLQRMDNALQRFKPLPLDEQEVFNKIKSRKERSAKVVSINWPSVWRIAAILIIGVGASYYFLQPTQADLIVTYQAAVGEMVDVTLPDKSRVTLNAGSSISYSKSEWKDNRIVNLTGEAFFEVEKGERFQVVTQSGTITVLGTLFNVKDRIGFFEVSCFEGKVEVKTTRSPLQLVANQAYREIQKQPVPIALSGTQPSWKQQETSFTSVPYSEVLHELERQYDVRIEVTDIDTTQLFTGRFPNHDLETALKSVTLPLNLHYQTTGKEIRFMHAE